MPAPAPRAKPSPPASPEGGPRPPRARSGRRRLRWGLGGAAILLVAGAVLGYLYGPRLAPWLLRHRVLPALERRTHRRIQVRAVRARWHEVVLRGVTVSGPRDCPGAPLVRAEAVRLRVSPWALLRGQVAVTGVSVRAPRLCLRRLADGTDNFRDLLRTGGRAAGKGRLRLRARQVRVRHGALRVRDEGRGLILRAGQWGGQIARRGRSQLWLRDVQMRGVGRAPVRAESISVSFLRNGQGALSRWNVGVAGGRVVAHRRLVLSDIRGSLRPRPGRRLQVALRGSYGDAGHSLWEARGTLALPGPGPRLPGPSTLRIRAERFTLDKLGPALPARLVVAPEQASLAADLSLSWSGRRLRFSGSVSLEGLTVRHPKLARQPVRDIGFSGQVRGFYDRETDLLRLERADLRRQAVRLHLRGDVHRLRGHPRFGVDLTLDRVDCGKFLRAVPRGLLPRLARMQLAGWFAMRIHAEADFKYLTTNSVTLTGDVDHRHCLVVSVPYALSAERLAGPFGHEFTDAGHRLGFEVGPDNPDFVPLDQISPYVIGAILTTEDSRFFYHHGFIPREFQSAFARNLIARRFVFGASSITMQMVKNVLLGRRKTLSRKLQELVLTWYLERHLSKQRILEIYLNVIEFGPGIYGIGRAAWHFFGKDASALEPGEAAYLASILPSPKRHYRKFCRQRVGPRWRRWVDRILKIMARRGRLTDDELRRALAAPITFSDREWQSRAACLARLHRFLPR